MQTGNGDARGFEEERESWMFDDQFAVEPDAQKLLMEPLLGGQKGSRAHVLWFRVRVSNMDFSFV